MHSSWTPPRSARVEVKDVNTHSGLFSTSPSSQQKEQWEASSAAFRSDGSPVTAQVVVTTVDPGVPIMFDDMPPVSMWHSARKITSHACLLTGMWGILI